MQCRVLIGLMLLALCAAPALGQSTRYVDDDAPLGGDGLSWATAYRFLKDATADAAGNPAITEIRVAGGTYYPDRDADQPAGTGDRGVSFSLRGNLALVGGYRGLEPGGDADDRDPSLFVSVLTGDIGAPGENSDNSQHVVSCEDPGSVTLQGLTITAGYGPGPGAGMCCINVDPTLMDCTVTNNTIVGPTGDGGKWGAGLYARDGDVILTRCVFTGNNSSGYGGGVFCNTGDATLTQCTFSNNWAQYDAGGIRHIDGHLAVTDCAFTQNIASQGTAGALLHNGDGSMEMTRCLLQSNQAGESGGGLGSFGESTIVDCTISGNTAGEHGGGARLGGAATITNCIVRGNTAGDRGGGLYVRIANLTAANTVFSGNVGHSRGGGAYTEDAATAWINCVFVGNAVHVYSNYGSGLVGGDGDDTAVNCIIWRNTGPTTQVSGTTVTYSCVYGGATGEGNTRLDPAFVDGDGPDDIYGTEDDDLHLSEGSPCINLGNDAAVPAGLTEDFEGDPRIQQDRVDAGVDETPYALTDCNENGVHDLINLGNGTSQDCNGNNIPDECEVADLALYVDDDTPPGGDGQSWAAPFSLLRTALTEALTAECIIEIRVAGGTYYPDRTETSPTGNGSRSATFLLLDGIAIRGGYRGLEPGGDPDDRDLALFESILSGDIGTPGNEEDNSFHVVTADGVSWRTVLNGVTVTAGCANGTAGSIQLGGGLYAKRSAYPTISSCTFRDNFAHYGGASCYDASGGILANCLFTGNRADQGAGLYNRNNSNPSLTNCTFHGNSADDGLALYAQNGSPTAANCIFWETASPISGPAMVTHSCVRGGYAGTGNISNDPLFVDADGPDGIAGTADDDLRLRPGSPCIDAGDNAAVPDGIETDLAGHARFLDDPDTPDTGVGTPPIADMGAYEFAPPPDCDGDGIPDSEELCGDLSDDGWVNVIDYYLFTFSYTLADGDAGFNACADYDYDGVVTAVDYQQWLMCYRDFLGDPLAPPPGEPTDPHIPDRATPTEVEVQICRPAGLTGSGTAAKPASAAPAGGVPIGNP